MLLPEGVMQHRAHHDKALGSTTKGSASDCQKWGVEFTIIGIMQQLYYDAAAVVRCSRSLRQPG